MLVFDKKLQWLKLQNRLGDLPGKTTGPCTVVKRGAAKSIHNSNVTSVFQKTIENGNVASFANQVEDRITELIARIGTETARQ